MKVWCVEDDNSIRDIEVYTLNSTDFEAKGFSDAITFRGALSAEKPDLIILDIMLPGEDGVELLKFLKDSPDTCRIPVIMATAKGMEYDKIQSLDLGADDYLVKPFAFEELLARIRCICRRPQAITNDDILVVSDITWFNYECRLSGPSGNCTLSKREAALLETFLRRKGQILSRSILLLKVWGPDSDVEEGNLDNYIHFIRRRLKGVGSILQIKTIRGIGYCLQDLSSQ